jgi:acyl-CoA thioesterase FadM
MNNGRYLTLMDLGRVDMMIRSGLIRAILREKWMPVIAGVSMIFRRSLNPFERYTLETRVLGWDDRWAYLEQTFLNAKGELAARGYVKAAFLKAGKRLDMGHVVFAGGATGPSPALDDALLALFPKSA